MPPPRSSRRSRPKAQQAKRKTANRRSADSRHREWAWAQSLIPCGRWRRHGISDWAHAHSRCRLSALLRFAVFLFACCAFGRDRRELLGGGIDDGECPRPKVKHPIAVPHLFEPDQLHLQRPAHVVLVTVPEQIAGVIDPPSFKLRRVLGLGQLNWVRAWRGLVVLCRRTLLERLVRAHLVVLLAPLIEPGLL